MTFKYIRFPDPNEYDDEGLVAIGGDLSSDMIISAYIQGLFPWYSENDPILWWSPNPRMILYPDKMKVSKSLNQSLRNKNISVRFDYNFNAVINNCAKVKRKNQEGTWILPEIIEAYGHLHQLGIAHSVEVYYNNNLCGGLYGLAIGKVFFGESMFHYRTDASKIALFHLCQKLILMQYDFIDVQQSTSHLKSIGAQDLPRIIFLKKLRESVIFPSENLNWHL